VRVAAAGDRSIGVNPYGPPEIPLRVA